MLAQMASVCSIVTIFYLTFPWLGFIKQEDAVLTVRVYSVDLRLIFAKFVAESGVK